MYSSVWFGLVLRFGADSLVGTDAGTDTGTDAVSFDPEETTGLEKVYIACFKRIQAMRPTNFIVSIELR
jgi:hypothetical protein